MSERFWPAPVRPLIMSPTKGAGQGWRRAAKAVRAMAVIWVVYIVGFLWCGLRCGFGSFGFLVRSELRLKALGDNDQRYCGKVGLDLGVFVDC